MLYGPTHPHTHHRPPTPPHTIHLSELGWCRHEAGYRELLDCCYITTPSEKERKERKERKQGPDLLDQYKERSRDCRQPAIVLTTTSLRSFYHSKVFAQLRLKAVCIDEASQLFGGKLAEIMIEHNSCHVLMGDSNQLPPHQSDDVQKSTKQNVSNALDLVRHHPSTKQHSLCTTYRLFSSLCSLIGRTFYEGRLQSADRCEQPWELGPDLVWVDTPEGAAECSQASTSKQNLIEAQVVSQLAAPYLCDGNCDVVILTPYSAQRTLIEQECLKLDGVAERYRAAALAVMTDDEQAAELAAMPPARREEALAAMSSECRAAVTTVMSSEQSDNPTKGAWVGTQARADKFKRFVFNIDAFQGQEADRVFVSLVDPSGFLCHGTGRQRTNVLLSRAKESMCVVGDFASFRDSSCKWWWELCSKPGFKRVPHAEMLTAIVVGTTQTNERQTTTDFRDQQPHTALTEVTEVGSAAEGGVDSCTIVLEVPSVRNMKASLLRIQVTPCHYFLTCNNMNSLLCLSGHS